MKTCSTILWWEVVPQKPMELLPQGVAGVAASVYNARFIKVKNKSFTCFNWLASISTKLLSIIRRPSFHDSLCRVRKHLRPWAEGRTESSMYAKPLRRHARPAKIQLRLAEGPESDQLQRYWQDITYISILCSMHELGQWCHFLVLEWGM